MPHSMTATRATRTKRSRTMAPAVIFALVAVALATPAADAAQPGDAGRFDTWVGYPLGKAPRFPAMGDLDGDGALDVVWGNAGLPGSVSVSLNVGDGSLLPSVEYAAAAGVSDLELADLDSDGDLDVVTTYFRSYTDEDIGVYLNDGTGLMTYVPVALGVFPTGLGVGDLDDDGDPDLVINSYDAAHDRRPAQRRGSRFHDVRLVRGRNVRVAGRRRRLRRRRRAGRRRDHVGRQLVERALGPARQRRRHARARPVAAAALDAASSVSTASRRTPAGTSMTTATSTSCSAAASTTPCSRTTATREFTVTTYDLFGARGPRSRRRRRRRRPRRAERWRRWRGDWVVRDPAQHRRRHPERTGDGRRQQQPVRRRRGRPRP